MPYKNAVSPYRALAISMLALHLGLSSTSMAHDTAYLHSHDAIGDRQLVLIDGRESTTEGDGRTIPGGYGGIVIDEMPPMVVTPTDNAPPIWSTPATLYVERCTPPDIRPGGGAGPAQPGGDLPGGPVGGPLGGAGGRDPLPHFCGFKPAKNESTIWWDVDETPRAITSTTSTLRFGPFRLIRKGRGGIANGSDTYRITIAARSAAMYAADDMGNTRFVGANPNHLVIGEGEFTLTGTEERMVYVTAELPSVVSAIRITAEVDDEFSQFPAACGNLPALSSNPEALDSNCLQAGINPLAVITPRFTPIGIIYEPPGNCSWSRLAQSHAVGVTASFAAENSRSERFVSDSGFAWDREHIDSTRVTTNAKDSSLDMTVAWTSAFATRYGGPWDSPGREGCNNEENPPPPRQAGGPGHGEVFLLFYNAPTIYWDTGKVRGSTLSPAANPAASPGLLMLSANQIRNDVGLPNGLTFSAEEKQAILALSPFAVSDDGSVTYRHDPKRFVEIGHPRLLGQGIPYEHVFDRRYQVGTGESLTEAAKRELGSKTESDPVVKYTMKALQAGMQKGLEKGAEALGGVNPLLGELAKGIAEEVEVPLLYQDQSTTTVNVTLRSSNRIMRTADDHVTQQFFIQDTNKGMSVALLYDVLFGSFLFLELEEGAGFVSDPALSGLPSIVVNVPESEVADGVFRLAEDVGNSLMNYGTYVLNPASSNMFRSADERVPVRMMQDVWVAGDAGRSLLPIADGFFDENGQALYIAENNEGEPVALVWVNSLDDE